MTDLGCIIVAKWYLVLDCLGGLTHQTSCPGTDPREEDHQYCLADTIRSFNKKGRNFLDKTKFLKWKMLLGSPKMGVKIRLGRLDHLPSVLDQVLGKDCSILFGRMLVQPHKFYLMSNDKFFSRCAKMEFAINNLVDFNSFKMNLLRYT